MTVFLSSHLLSEVEQVATHFAIISQGQLKFEGTPEQLQILSEQVIEIEADQPESAQSFLTTLGHSVTRQGDTILIPAGSHCDAAQINRLLGSRWNRSVASGNAAQNSGGHVPGSHQLADGGDGLRRPMTLWRGLETEMLKMKRTIALKVVLLAPAAVLVLVVLMAVNAPFSTIRRGGAGGEWAGLTQLMFLSWAALMMPL